MFKISAERMMNGVTIKGEDNLIEPDVWKFLESIKKKIQKTFA